MNEPGRVMSPAAKTILVTAAVVIVIAGMKQAAPLLVPFLLSVFIAILCLPPMKMLQAKGLGTGLSITLVVVGVFITGVLLAWLIGSSIEAFNNNLPMYQSKISGQWLQVITWLQTHGVVIPQEFVSDNLDPGAAMKLIATVLASFGNVLANAFLIFLTVIFILLESTGFNNKLKRIGWASEDGVGEQFVERLRLYMSIKTSMSALTGVLVALVLWLLGVDYPALWGVLAFMFNYVPNIGSIIAAVPAVLLALVQLGSGVALLVAAAYFVINIIVGNVLEPRYMGRGLGLSTLVVFLSLVFWGWILGPVGMLLSVPLTVSVKLALDANAETRWCGVLLGNN